MEDIQVIGPVSRSAQCSLCQARVFHHHAGTGLPKSERCRIVIGQGQTWVVATLVNMVWIGHVMR